MYFTLRMSHHCLSRSIRLFARVFLVGGLILCGSATPNAGSELSGILPLVELQAAPAKGKSVKAQTDNLYKSARKEIRSGNVEKGQELLQQILILDPQHAKAKEELVKLAGPNGDLKPKDATIAAASGGTIPTTENMSSAELIDVAKSMMRDGDYANADKVLNQALAKSKNDKERRQIRSYLNAINKDQQQKQQSIQKQMDYNLTEFDSHLQKATIYLDHKQYDKAEEELQQAGSINPNDPRVLAMQNRVAQEQGAGQKLAESALVKEQQSQNTREKAMADVLFEEGVALYRQGQVIQAVNKWRQAIQTYPAHQASHTYLSNTILEYEQAVAAQKTTQEKRADDEKYEQMLDTEIPQYSTQGERVDVKDVYSLLSTLSGLNVVMGENVEGNVALDVKNTTVRGILNLLQHQYGFVWRREGDTLFIERGFKTRVFPLTEGQYRTIETILGDPTSLEDSSRNLRVILYGPADEFNVPGKQLYLNKTSQSLLVTDTEDNIRTVEAFLRDMPVITGEKKPVETRVYQLDRDVARDIYEIVRLMLYEGEGNYDVRDNRRKLFLEDNSNSMIVIDYPENIQRVEEYLQEEATTGRLEEGELDARQFKVTDVDDVEDTPESLARREEYVAQLTDVIEQMLYGKTTREAAILQGRRVIASPARGTIDVVDTPQNIRRVEEYLGSVRGETTQDILIETYPIEHVDVGTIADALAYLFFDQQQSTRAQFMSSTNFQTVGSSEQADNTVDPGNIFEETTRNRFNLTGGGGGGTDLLQFFSIRLFPDIFTNSIVVFTPDQEVLDIVRRVITTFDKPARMVEMESRIVSVSLTDLRAINFDYILTNPLIEPISINPEKSDQIWRLSGDQSSGQDEGINFSLHTFGQSRLDFLMNLLETTESVNLLSAPKIVMLPNPLVPSFIFVGQQIPYAEDADFEDQGDDDPTNNRIAVDFQRTSAGVSLGALPFILNDDHIYMEITPQIVEVGERLPLTIQGPVAPGQAIPNIGPLLLNQKIIQTSVRMKNGATVVMGGLIDEKESESQNKVPVLSKIPFLGALFTDRNIEKTKTSTLVFVTARIIEPEY